MHRFIKRLPIVAQFLVIVGFLFTLALVQNLFDRTGLEGLFTSSSQKIISENNQVRAISLACLFS